MGYAALAELFLLIWIYHFTFRFKQEDVGEDHGS